MNKDIQHNDSVSDVTGENLRGVSVAPSDREKLLGSSERLADEKKRNMLKWGLIGGLMLIIVILAIVLPLIFKKNLPPDPIGPAPLPGGLMNPYQTVGGKTTGTPSGTELSGYLSLNIQQTKLEEWRTQALTLLPKSFLSMEDSKASKKPIGVDWRNKNFFGVNNDFKRNLSYSLWTSQADQFRVRITTANETRFQIPSDFLASPGSNPDYRLELYGLKMFNPKYENFGFEVHDVTNPENWFLDTRNQTFIFADKYIQMDFKIPSWNVYGLGDRYTEFKLLPGAYNMWASGQDPQQDNGKGRGGLSGVHPFVMFETGQKRRYVGLFFRNSAAMTPVIRYNEDGTGLVSLITIGGDIDVQIFVKGTAKQVIEEYHRYIGYPRLPPYWALGWQEASVHGSDQASVLQAAKNYSDAQLPLDALYMPLSSWVDGNDFTVSQSSFPSPQQLLNTLHQSNQRLVGYVDSAISASNRSENEAYKKLQKAAGLIKSTMYGEKNPDGLLVNKKNGGKPVVYIDWLNQEAQNEWQSLLGDYLTKVAPFDGLWTTENEPFGEINGEIDVATLGDKIVEREQRILSQKAAATPDVNPNVDQSWFYSFWPLNSTSTYKLPFIPQFKQAGNYDTLTLSLNGSHSKSNVQEYEAHNLYSHAMMKSMWEQYISQFNDSRPFMLTRGSFASSGRYASQAHTNNERSYDNLYYAMNSVIRSQMFGIPHSGADLCGYKGDGAALDEELCLRWYQLATFFPLARHSQSPSGPRTEPFFFSKYQNQVRKTMHDRMQYLRLMYTCMFETTINGGTCLDPLEFLFNVPEDKQTWGGEASKTFMFAGKLKVSPILNKTLSEQTTFQSYFPKGLWVNMADFSEIINGGDKLQTLQVRDTVNVHLAPGALISFQDNSDMSIMTTQHSLNKSIMLVVNRDSDNTYAEGTLFLDKGESKSELDNEDWEYYRIYAQANSIQVKGWKHYSGKQPHQLDKIALVNSADLKDTDFACFYRPDNPLQPVLMTPLYDNVKQTLYLKPQQAVKFSEIENIYYGSKQNGDLNLCGSTNGNNSDIFNYKIVGSTNPNQDATNVTGLKNVTYELQYMGRSKIDNIELFLGFFDSGIVNVKWSWKSPQGKRTVFKVTDELVNTTMRDVSGIYDTLEKFVNISDSPFSIIFKTRLTSQKTEAVLTIKGLIYDQYMNWVNLEANAQPSKTEEAFKGIMGLGERASKDMFLKSGVYPIWNTDVDNPTDDGILPGKQTYGSHPFYMFKHAKNSWIGVYHNLAQATDYWVNNDYVTGKVGIQQIAAGGYGDIYVILSSQKPESIIAKYFSLIGSPVLTPQWALGWNQCRWCYRQLADVNTSMQGYLENGIPLDTQWVDIDYMQDYKDFTYNDQDYYGTAGKGAFSGLGEFVDHLHSMNMKFVPIIDAGISQRPGQNYSAYDEGIKQNIFLKLPSKELAGGKVWPNEAVYPDFLNPDTSKYWSSQLQQFQGLLKFDGLWQDMNEASNFCNGDCQKDFDTAGYTLANKLPYTPTGKRLDFKAIQLDAVHADGSTELDSHSFFGSLQVKASDKWFKSQNRRTMIISRSNFAGMGKYGSIWLGDNHASVEDMEISVISSMKMNMFGIPLNGADICGFGGNSTTAQLCTRWHQVGAFYTFSRNHRACWGNPQEPWRFNTTMYDVKQNISYMDLMKEAIYTKYSLIRYYYTQMSQVSFSNNTYYTVYKPLFFEFSEDEDAYLDIANNVMIGSALKISVNAKNLTQEETDFYFPQGTWCSLFGPTVGKCIPNEFGQAVTFSTKLHEYYVHLREGYIVPLQQASELKVRTTVDLQAHPIDLHILGSYKVPGSMAWSAEGFYVNDDGLTLDLNGNVNQYKVNAYYAQNETDNTETISVTVGQVMLASNFYSNTTNCSSVNQADLLQSIYIYNADSFKQSVNYTVSVSYNDAKDDYTEVGSASFDEGTNRLVFVAQEYLCLSRVFRIIIKTFVQL